MARIGPHVNRYHATAGAPLAAHIRSAIREAETSAGLTLGAAAVFVGGPQKRELNLRAGEAKELRELARGGLRLVAHSVYCADPWRGDPSAAAFIRSEAEACQAAGFGGLVVHLPKQPPAAVFKYLPRLLSRDAPGVVIYLETPAVVPRETYYESPEKLERLFQGVRDLGVGDRVGLCVDTAHLWTSGVDLQTYAAADAWFRGLERKTALAPERVMLHCNDSLRERGRGPDSHAGLGQGKIWEPFAGRLGESGLGAVLDYATRHESTLILERKPKEALLPDYRELRTLLAAPGPLAAPKAPPGKAPESAARPGGGDRKAPGREPRGRRHVTGGEPGRAAPAGEHPPDPSATRGAGILDAFIDALLDEL